MILKFRVSKRRTLNIGAFMTDKWGRFNPHLTVVGFVDMKVTSIVAFFTRRSLDSDRRFSLHSFAI